MATNITLNTNQTKNITFNIGGTYAPDNLDFTIDTSAPELADVAYTGSYSSLGNVPPPRTSINNGVLTIKVGNNIIGTFTANASSPVVINLPGDNIISW